MGKFWDKINKLTTESSYTDIENIVLYDFKQEADLYYKQFFKQKLSNGDTFNKETLDNIIEICNTYKYEIGANPIKNWLKYRIVYAEIEDVLIFSYGKDYYLELTKRLFDCDSCDLTKSIFKELKWPNAYIDTINSFWTVYKQAIKSKYNVVYNVNLKDYKKLLDKFDNYSEVNNSAALQNFARSNHTIGNFMPCPQGFNSFKGNYYNKFDDRLDLTLLGFTDNRRSYNSNINITGFVNYFKDNKEKLILNPYYDIDKNSEDFIITKLYPENISNLNNKEIDNALSVINKIIMIRGLMIILKLQQNVKN